MLIYWRVIGKSLELNGPRLRWQSVKLSKGRWTLENSKNKPVCRDVLLCRVFGFDMDDVCFGKLECGWLLRNQYKRTDSSNWLRVASVHFKFRQDQLFGEVGGLEFQQQPSMCTSDASYLTFPAIGPAAIGWMRLKSTSWATTPIGWFTYLYPWPDV